MKFINAINSKIARRLPEINRFALLKVLALNPVSYNHENEWKLWPNMPNLESLSLEFKFLYTSLQVESHFYSPNANKIKGIENIAIKCPQMREFKISGVSHEMNAEQWEEILTVWSFLQTFTMTINFQGNADLFIDLLQENCKELRELTLNGSRINKDMKPIIQAKMPHLRKVVFVPN